ncbi:hypothetical protein LOC54_03370 [Acetobacter sp. AN02]|uniref:hypothetical protein n=1 Tax=Acetobacter sp. AN02 TaxID=2894186 RepID=UPI0024341B11|nr:hypothetical protein [Acetobacter sp. AN02]MDG6094163.1 hypothetical protein [Acetobacter sp. AN02]
MIPPPEPQLQEQPEPQSGRPGMRLLMAAAGVMLVTGGAAWFTAGQSGGGRQSDPTGNPAPSQAVQETDGNRTGVPVVGLALIAPENAPQALRKAGYSPADQERILAGIKRREYRLVHMPVFDAGGQGGVVSVRSGIMTKVVHLSPRPQDIILPILFSGEVRITPLSAPGEGGVQPGALTVMGPVILPVIHDDQYLILDVVAQ